MLRRLMRVGRPSGNGGPLEPLALRGFARAVGVSAPTLLALIRGESKRMRLLTYAKLIVYLKALQRGPGQDSALQTIEYLKAQGFDRERIVGWLGGSARAEPTLRRAREAARVRRAYLEALIAFMDCVAFTFSLPPGSEPERKRLEAIVLRRRSTPFAAVRL